MYWLATRSVVVSLPRWRSLALLLRSAAPRHISSSPSPTLRSLSLARSVCVCVLMRARVCCLSFCCVTINLVHLYAMVGSSLNFCENPYLCFSWRKKCYFYVSLGNNFNGNGVAFVKFDWCNRWVWEMGFWSLCIWCAPSALKWHFVSKFLLPFEFFLGMLFPRQITR